MFSLLLLLFVILSGTRLSNTQKLPFDTIVSFGDDNTDTGNVYNLTNHQWPLVPPYYNLGCFTNGPVWIQKLGISKIMNYAYDGATIDNDNLVVGYTHFNKTRVPGVRQQILNYLSNNDLNTIDLSRTLYVIWAGANDYLDNSSLPSDLIVAGLVNAVNDLIPGGIEHILVINQPPLQAFPFFRQSNEYSTLSSRILDHNNYLASNISQVNMLNDPLTVYTFDLYSLITNILSNNYTSKLNKIDQCWNIVNESVISKCSNPNQYVFIDDYHFTTLIHQSIADSISQFLSTSSAYYFILSKLLFFICIIVFIINRHTYHMY